MQYTKIVQVKFIFFIFYFFHSKKIVENDEEATCNKKNGSDYGFNNCNCIIDRIFTGGLQSDVICSNCK